MQVPRLDSNQPNHIAPSDSVLTLLMGTVHQENMSVTGQTDPRVNVYYVGHMRRIIGSPVLTHA